MKVNVNYPELEDDMLELESRVADFRATLLIEKINHLNVKDSTKKEILNSIIADLKNIICE